MACYNKKETMARNRTWDSAALFEGPRTLRKRGAANYGVFHYSYTTMAGPLFLLRPHTNPHMIGWLLITYCHPEI